METPYTDAFKAAYAEKTLRSCIHTFRADDEFVRVLRASSEAVGFERCAAIALTCRGWRIQFRAVEFRRGVAAALDAARRARDISARTLAALASTSILRVRRTLRPRTERRCELLEDALATVFKLACVLEVDVSAHFSRRRRLRDRALAVCELAMSNQVPAAEVADFFGISCTGVRQIAARYGADRRS